MLNAKSSKSYALLATAILVGATACAPEPKNIEFPAPSTEGGPKLQDIDLKLNGTSAVGEIPSLSIDVPAPVALRFIENVLLLKGAHSESEKQKLSVNFINALPRERTKIADSPYVNLLVDQSKKLAEESLDEVVPKVKKARADILSLLKSLPAPVQSTNKDLGAIVDDAFDYLNTFNEKTQRLKLMKEIREGIASKLKEYLGQKSKIDKSVAAIERASTIRTALDGIEQISKDLNFAIPTSRREKMKVARSIGEKADSFNNPQGALALLVDVWLYLPANERAATFTKTSPDLYNYFKGLSDNELRCLQRGGCFSLPKWIAKNLVIYPKLQEFGLDRLRNEVNKAGADAVKSEVKVAIVAELKSLPSTIKEQINEAFDEAMEPVTKLQKDFDGEMKKRLNSWAKKSIEKRSPSVLALKPTQSRLKLDSKSRVSFEWKKSGSDSVETNGALQALTTHMWQSAYIDGDQARSLLFSDVTTLSRDYLQSKKPSDKPESFDNLLAVGFAERVRGFAKLAAALKDWKSSAIDASITGHKAQGLFPEFKIPGLDKELFPKSAFFALGFNSLSMQLKLMNTPQTPVFLIGNIEDGITPSNERASSDDTPAVMAGIANRENNKLSQVARAADVARYLLSMTEVLKAMDEIEQTQSEALLEADANGRTPKDEILENRETIRMLIIGLSNYLSHQFRSGGELVRSELNLVTQTPTSDAATVLDQALAIRALVAASDALKNNLYHWEAADLLIAMNRNLYRSDLKFYADKNEDSINPLTLLETLLAIDAVTPHLSEPSRLQVEAMAQPWKAQVAKWQIVD